jgi:hypothetical protein
MYPARGHGLVPPRLAEHLADAPVSDELAAKYDLGPHATLGDLDAGVWWRYDTAVVEELAAGVVNQVRNRMRRIRNDLQPMISAPIPLSQLDISLRTRNSLHTAGGTQNGWVVPMPLGRLATAQQVGAHVLLDLLTAVASPSAVVRNNAHEDLPNPPAPAPVTERRPSRTVAREAKALARKRWATKIRATDPRLGPALVNLHLDADTPAEAADLLRNGMFEPVEAKSAARRIREFIAEGDRLRRLTLDKEMATILDAAVTRPKARRVVAARLGLGGEKPVTLEVASRLGGFSRERARQLEASFRRHVSEEASSWTPALERALRLVQQAAPLPPAAVSDLLRAEGITEHEWAVPALLRAAEVFECRPGFAYEPKTGLVMPDGLAVPAAKVAAAARKLISHWGTTTVNEVVIELHTEPPAPEVVAGILEQIPGFEWLGEGRDWFWIKGTARNRLLNQIEKIMSVAGSIDLADLRHGVARHYRMEGFRPPRAVLAKLCEATGLYRVGDDRVYGTEALPDWREILGKIERTMVEILFEHGPVMRKDELEHLAIERGLNKNSTAVYLTYSPVLRRYAPGVWGLRGAPVTAAKVEALIPPRVSHQVLQDHGWSPDGKVWMAYKISPAGATTGVLGVPGSLKKIARGRFALSAEDGRPVGTAVLEESIWGLSSFFHRYGVEAGDFVVLAVDLGTNTATIAVGTQELVARFQGAE